MNDINIKIKKLNPRAQLPCYATAGSAGMDISACIDTALTLGGGSGRW
jgi:dUTPase